MDSDNPWQVESIEAFYFLKCPECMFFTQNDNSFYHHAVENHSLSFALFGKSAKSKELLAQKGILNEDVHFELKQTKNCEFENNDKDELSDELSDKLSDELLNKQPDEMVFEHPSYTPEATMNELVYIPETIHKSPWKKPVVSESSSNDSTNQKLMKQKTEGNTRKEISKEIIKDQSCKNTQIKAIHEKKKPVQTLGVSSNGQAQIKTRLRRVACTCPNCKNGDRGQKNNADGKPRKKQHNCHIPGCNKIYGKTSHLRAHLRRHSDEKPFVCNWISCGKRFTRSDELQRHRRTHSGEKRFACSECNKKFMRRDHLSKHIKTHQKGSSLGLPTHGLLNRWTLQFYWGSTTGWLERIVNILQISHHNLKKLSVCTSMRVIVFEDMVNFDISNALGKKLSKFRILPYSQIVARGQNL
jgi:uncharacterized Zn-finger protein